MQPSGSCDSVSYRTAADAGIAAGRTAAELSRFPGHSRCTAHLAMFSKWIASFFFFVRGPDYQQTAMRTWQRLLACQVVLGRWRARVSCEQRLDTQSAHPEREHGWPQRRIAGSAFAARGPEPLNLLKTGLLGRTEILGVRQQAGGSVARGACKIAHPISSGPASFASVEPYDTQ